MKFTVFCVLFAVAAAGALFIIFKPIINEFFAQSKQYPFFAQPLFHRKNRR